MEVFLEILIEILKLFVRMKNSKMFLLRLDLKLLSVAGYHH